MLGSGYIELPLRVEDRKAMCDWRRAEIDRLREEFDALGVSVDG